MRNRKDRLAAAFLLLCIGVIAGCRMHYEPIIAANDAYTPAPVEMAMPVAAVAVKADPAPEPTPEDQSDDAAEMTLTDEEITLLARLSELETATHEGRIAVVQVVMNRVEDPRFPDTVEEVVYQKGQFSPAKRIPDAEPDPESALSVRAWLSGERVIEGTPLFFCSVGKTHEGREYISEAGGNRFYR